MIIDYSDENASREVDAYLLNLHEQCRKVEETLKARGHQPGMGRQMMSDHSLNVLDKEERDEIERVYQETRRIMQDLESRPADPADNNFRVPMGRNLRAI